MLTSEFPSYDQQFFGPRNRGIGHVDVGLPQAFAERKKLSFTVTLSTTH